MLKVNFYCILFTLILACNFKPKQQADSIYYHGHIITMDDSLKYASAMVVKDGKIIAVGGDDLLQHYECEANQKIDLKLQYVYPGLIDAHCHFYGYAKSLMGCDLTGTTSWDQVVQRLDSFYKQHTDAKWIIGRGWDQNDWKNTSYPNNTLLNQIFKDKPVLLKRIDGHAAICNQKALDVANIGLSTTIKGGEIIKRNGHLSGVLVDNAVDLVEKFVVGSNNSELITALQAAEKECYSLGLTTLADAGLDLKQCMFLDSLSKVNQLSIYLYLMLNPSKESLDYATLKGILETDNIRIGSFKLYADGALGSRGAKLKSDYCDRKGHSGMFLQSMSYYDSFCNLAYQFTKYQVNTHCIGDSANRLLLETYGHYSKPNEDRRWRIEHAQIIDIKDIPLFGKYHIIPSVQPTHASSDAPWVKDRICEYRMAGAYAYKTLLSQNGYLPLGTDFPVEYLNPLFTFYSAVFRMNAMVPSQEAFLINESLSREQALKGMTIWAAKGCMLEHRKGSISTGKDADFVIMDKNLLESKQDEVLKTKILATYRMGLKVY